MTKVWAYMITGFFSSHIRNFVSLVMVPWYGQRIISLYEKPARNNMKIFSYELNYACHLVCLKSTILVKIYLMMVNEKKTIIKIDY